MGGYGLAREWGPSCVSKGVALSGDPRWLALRGHEIRRVDQCSRFGEEQRPIMTDGWVSPR